VAWTWLDDSRPKQEKKDAMISVKMKDERETSFFL